MNERTSIDEVQLLFSVKECETFPEINISKLLAEGVVGSSYRLLVKVKSILADQQAQSKLLACYEVTDGLATLEIRQWQPKTRLRVLQSYCVKGQLKEYSGKRHFSVSITYFALLIFYFT